MIFEAERYQTLVALAGKGDSPTLRTEWARVVADCESMSIDAAAMVEWVMREAFLEEQEALRVIAAKVRFYNELKRALGEELAAARAFLALQARVAEFAPLSGAYHGATGSSRPVKFPTAPAFSPQTGRSVRWKLTPDTGRSLTTKKDLIAYVSFLERQLNSITEKAQLSSLELQNYTQQQQQTFQMMSNVSKALQDTAESIARNVRD